MNVTVILCTYNRCQSLAAALESVAVSQLPDSVSWEVLVVDNNSKDETRKVVESIRQRYPKRFRYSFEPQQGKSYALNTGIREARGKILAFMDDDVVVDAKWLQNLTAVLLNADFAGAGGLVLPERNFAPPAWLSLKGRYALAPLAIFDLGSQPGELTEAPFGTNMAFRKEVFEKIGGFRTDLGPRPGSEARGEDTDFGDRALAAGQRLWYEPSAIVYHSLPAHRLKKEYFLAWWHDKAQTDLRTVGLSPETGLQIGGVPVRYFRRLTNWTLQWITAINPARRFSCKLKVWIVKGEIAECRRLSTQAKHQGEKCKA
jgi:glycosyltransferase involved in cell wall biosynthesis